MKLGRNDPCHCGSGKKYKNCCLGKTEFRPPQPQSVEFNQLVALFNAGHHAELESRTRSLLGRYPNSGFAWKLLGASLQMQGKDALPVLQKAAELLPDDADAFSNLGVALKDRGQLDGALASLRRALEIKPDFAEAHNNLGAVLIDLGQLNEAVSSCRRALEIKPDYARAHNNLGNALKNLGQLDDAVASYRRALNINPDFAEAHSNLGNALQSLGQPDDAAASYRRALEIKPDSASAFSSLLMIMQYAEGNTQAGSFAEHLAYAQRFEDPLKKDWLPHANLRDPGKRLKIGYVSPDFRNHSVAFFIEPVLARHNREQVEVYCYYTHSAADKVTARLKSLADHWRDIGTMSDAEAAIQIGEDGIDILVDLAGHTASNRLQVFARKPAPVQITWLGYCDTTGLTAIDHLLADERVIPLTSQQKFSETVYRLPHSYLCYQAPPYTPPPAPPPLLVNGYVTFGCFNNLAKATEAMLETWVALLQRLPDSRLILKSKALGAETTRQRCQGFFLARGIAQNRILLVGDILDHQEQFAYYHRVDIALDTYPYNGVTTTCDALWMGVPVVTLAGDQFISRNSAGILANLKLPELIATGTGQYVEIATDLAGNPDKLIALRQELRSRFCASPLGNPTLFTRNLESAYRDMWQTWCAQQA